MTQLNKWHASKAAQGIRSYDLVKNIEPDSNPQLEIL